MLAFNTTANLHHITPLPPGTTFEAGIKQLQDHDFLIRLDPELAHYETLPPDEALPNAKRYKVTDNMHTLPKGLWDTTVSFESQITNTADGVDWAILAPLGLRQHTTWRLLRSEEVETGDDKNNSDKGNTDGKTEWSLVEDVEIKASRLLVGTVKGKCEENWRGIHAAFVEKLRSAESKA
ncbi:hypothetical protein BDV95DRAFT_562194 [Massariosphaeria phaeospora]|uniref:DUF7053 domain-containing protein n=1 Tax=Massariosphaeria phaeospora TaxID=100035 RepID=A0A7C8IBQ6_9PLEO|nr:hypothetical protein BDV95DRAFT_562194 [Massariosphaeria phaeospora]